MALIVLVAAGIFRERSLTLKGMCSLQIRDSSAQPYSETSAKRWFGMEIRRAP